MKNIKKQEELVSALWDFAKGLQNSNAIKSGSCAKSIDKYGEETKMDMMVMREAIYRIAENFGLEIQSIQ